jgi:hypothetical protein
MYVTATQAQAEVPVTVLHLIGRRPMPGEHGTSSLTWAKCPTWAAPAW